MPKEYQLNSAIGKVKYSISFHDGIQMHKDGSPFFGIMTFSNKKKFRASEKELIKEGYILS